jgi:5-hydroxyisourate hydrolase
MGTLSTHVLDTSLGMPARGVRVRLDAAPSSPFSMPSAPAPAPAHAAEPLGDATTDEDGRVTSIGPERLEAGTYRLTFDSGTYFEQSGRTGFYPEVVVVFTVTDRDEHYHVPVLLNPYGYTTYRGS